MTQTGYCKLCFIHT